MNIEHLRTNVINRTSAVSVNTTISSSPNISTSNSAIMTSTNVSDVVNNNNGNSSTKHVVEAVIEKINVEEDQHEKEYAIEDTDELPQSIKDTCTEISDSTDSNEKCK